MSTFTSSASFWEETRDRIPQEHGHLQLLCANRIALLFSELSLGASARHRLLAKGTFSPPELCCGGVQVGLVASLHNKAKSCKIQEYPRIQI